METVREENIQRQKEKDLPKEEELPGEKQGQIEKEKTREKRNCLNPIENLYWLQQCENLNPLKDFFSSIQLTKNALTYQTRAQRALCPHITDFLLRANGKTRSFVSALPGPTNLFLITGCMWGLQNYWYIVFPFTRIAACIWSNIDTTWTQWKAGERLERYSTKRDLLSYSQSCTTAPLK